jgi:hypothetical protein
MFTVFRAQLFPRNSQWRRRCIAIRKGRRRTRRISPQCKPQIVVEKRAFSVTYEEIGKKLHAGFGISLNT